jgi:hypothetical protein
MAAESDGVVNQQAYRFSRPRRRRRRERSLNSDRDAIADLDRIIVGFSRPQAQPFKRHAIPVQFGEHDRSPFVVSLRGVALSLDSLAEDECIPEQEYVARDIPTASYPNLDTIRSLAGDLLVDVRDLETVYGNQFTEAAIDDPNIVILREDRSQKSEVRRSTFDFRSLASDFGLRFGNVRSWLESKRSRPRNPETRHLVMRVAVIAIVLALIAAIPAGLFGLVRDILSQRIAVAEAGEQAVNTLASSANASDLAASSAAFREASDRFRQTDDILSQTNVLALGLAQLIPSVRSGVKSAHALLTVGSSASDAAQVLTQGLDAAVSGSSKGLLERLAALSAYAEGAKPMIDKAAASLKDVDPSVLSQDQQEKFQTLSSLVADGQTAVRDFLDASHLMLALLGRDQPRRYLIIFQNPSELRPTGGFMGSFAQLDIDKGAITSLVVPGGGTYDVKGQLIAQIIPPKPLQLIAQRWEFQDANWSPDFPTAAKTMEYFWNKSGGYSVDGIIAVNATVFRDLLKITGPINIPELGKTITADNFMDETQKAVELEYDKTENQPKKILSLMAPIMMERLKTLDRDGLIRAFGVFASAVDKKDIQIALTDDAENAQAQELGWSGTIKTTTGDALAIIDANIAGQKTDSVVNEQANVQTTIANDGTISDDVTLIRTHTGKKGDLFTGVRNVSYVRFYLPRGTTLLKAEGFVAPDPSYFKHVRDDAVSYSDSPDLMAEASSTAIPGPGGVSVWDEGTRTVVGGWSMVDPGHAATLHLTYRLPFTAFDIHDRLMKEAGAVATDAETPRAVYSMLFTSQSGKPDRMLTTSIQAPSSWNRVWMRSGSSTGQLWSGDKVISALYETK